MSRTKAERAAFLPTPPDGVRRVFRIPIVSERSSLDFRDMRSPPHRVYGCVPASAANSRCSIAPSVARTGSEGSHARSSHGRKSRFAAQERRDLAFRAVSSHATGNESRVRGENAGRLTPAWYPFRESRPYSGYDARRSVCPSDCVIPLLGRTRLRFVSSFMLSRRLASWEARLARECTEASAFVTLLPATTSTLDRETRAALVYAD